MVKATKEAEGIGGKELDKEALAALEKLMGKEDLEVFLQFKSKQDDKKLKSKVREKADELLGEGGPYFDEYERATDKLKAIEDKAEREAKKILGVESEETD